MAKGKRKSKRKVVRNAEKPPKGGMFPVASVYKESKPGYTKPTIRHGSQTYYKKIRIS